MTRGNEPVVEAAAKYAEIARILGPHVDLILIEPSAPLRAEQARLRNLNVDMSGLKLVTIDKEAIEPLGPAKPKKILVILAGVVLGLVLGIITALVSAAVQRRRENRQ